MLEKIDKKIIVAGLLLVLLFSFYLYTYFISSKPDFLYQMNGRIEEIKDGSIVISGTVKSLDPNDSRQESKTIEFKTTSQTVFKTNALVITPEQFRSGKTFRPETQQRPGTVSDLTDDMVVQVWSRDVLFAVSKAEAAEIHYISYDFPEQ